MQSILHFHPGKKDTPSKITAGNGYLCIERLSRKGSFETLVSSGVLSYLSSAAGRKVHKVNQRYFSTTEKVSLLQNTWKENISCCGHEAPSHITAGSNHLCIEHLSCKGSFETLVSNGVLSYLSGVVARKVPLGERNKLFRLQNLYTPNWQPSNVKSHTALPSKRHRLFHIVGNKVYFVDGFPMKKRVFCPFVEKRLRNHFRSLFIFPHLSRQSSRSDSSSAR